MAKKDKNTYSGNDFLGWPGKLYINEDFIDEINRLSGGVGKGTVDELGFETLYDRIAESLFPWCSTLTSRARYFLFSLAVLDLALERTLSRQKLDPLIDRKSAKEIALLKFPVFIRHIRSIERHLALSLVIKHQQFLMNII